MEEATSAAEEPSLTDTMSELSTVSTRLNTLSSKFNDMQQDIRGLRECYTTLKNEVTTMRDELKGFREECASLPERKTSLGRDWHPSCLRCVQCGRVLSPGQHAEHKGNPYCHTPCYNALFGPNLLGYGSNLASPANFAKKENAAEFGHDYDDDVYKREIYSTSRNSAAAVRRQKQRQSAPPSIIGHDFSAAPPASPDSRTNLVLQSGGKKSAALSSTRSADSLDTTQCGSSVDRPSLLATGPLVDSSVNDHPSELKSSTNSSPSANKSTVNHSRSKSEQVLSAVVDNHQSGLSSVVRGQDGNVPGTKSPPANSVGSSDVPASEEYSVKRTLPESGYLAPAVKKDVSSPAK
ncbi:hypothetical protein ACOMHN_061140 [Nucella lapillus]